jgi:hypothetical protein
MRYIILVLALAVASVVCAEDGIGDAKQLAKLRTEIERLQKKYPLKFEVDVIVLSKEVYGWFNGRGTRENAIVIVDRGTGQNKRTLRHEWCHAKQKSDGRPFDEREAYAAERDE